MPVPTSAEGLPTVEVPRSARDFQGRLCRQRREREERRVVEVHAFVLPMCQASPCWAEFRASNGHDSRPEVLTYAHNLMWSLIKVIHVVSRYCTTPRLHRLELTQLDELVNWLTRPFPLEAFFICEGSAGRTSRHTARFRRRGDCVAMPTRAVSVGRWRALVASRPPGIRSPTWTRATENFLADRVTWTASGQRRSLVGGRRRQSFHDPALTFSRTRGARRGKYTSRATERAG